MSLNSRECFMLIFATLHVFGTKESLMWLPHFPSGYLISRVILPPFSLHIG